MNKFGNIFVPILIFILFNKEQMKTKSVLLFFSGIAIGAMGNFLLTATKGRSKRRRELSKKSRHYNKAFKDTASKYREKLGSLS